MLMLVVRTRPWDQFASRFKLRRTSELLKSFFPLTPFSELAFAQLSKAFGGPTQACC